MLKNKLTLVGICLFLGLITQAQNSMSLEQCITYALENHNSVKNAKLEQEKAAYKITETKATGLPQVNGKIDFMENVKVQSQFIPEKSPFNPTGDANKTTALAFGVQHTAGASITASQMLFNGSYLVGLQAAKTYSDLSLQAKEQNDEEVRVNVTKAYYGALVNILRKEMLMVNKAQIEKFKSDASIMVKEGVLEAVELSKLTVNLNNLLTELEKVDAVQRISDNLLKFNMGMGLEEQITLSDNLETVLKNLETTTPELNVAARKDYRLMETQMLLTELNIKNYKMSFLPNANLFGTVGANNGTLAFSELPKFGNWRNYGFIGAQINVPMFSSFKNKSLIQQEEVNKEILQNNMNSATQGFELEYYQLVDSYKNYQSSLSRQKENLDMAIKIFENTRIKYEAGMATSYELLTDDSALKQAQIGYLSTVYDLLVTKVELDKTSGNLK